MPSLRRSGVAALLLSMGPAVLLYAIGLPLLGGHLDRSHGVVLSTPGWLRWTGAVVAALGLVVAAWSGVSLVRRGRGTPNPALPPRALVTSGPYGRSRNPLVLGGWLFGVGLAVMLSSPSLLALYASVIAAGIVHVRRFEEPELETRFGDEYRRYTSRVPRWLIVVLSFAAVAAPVSAQQEVPPRSATPAVVVRIDVVPGGARAWMALFEEYVVPAIRDAIAAGDRIVGFEYFEGVVASESTDVVLVLAADTFSFFDERRPFPHYRVLFARLGPEEGRRVLAEMTALERSVEVTLVRAFGDRGSLP